MARSAYIYHVRRKGDGELLASFTVKREAHEWVKRSQHEFRDLTLNRMSDGVTEWPIKFETVIPWDKPSAKEVAELLSEQFMRNRQFVGQK